MRTNKIAWIEDLRKLIVHLNYDGVQPICTNTTCDHKAAKKFQSNLQYYLHYLEAKLWPCLACQVMDEKWIILKDELHSLSPDDITYNAKAQHLITSYIFDLRYHFRTNLGITVAERNNCFSVINELMS